MEQLRGKRPKSHDGYLMTSLREMRDKLEDFFTYEGRDLLAICGIPELRKGRKAGGQLGRYTVEWELQITGHGPVPRFVKGQADPLIAVPGRPLLTSGESQAMDLALAKMAADFSFSALNNQGDLQQCVRAAYQSAEFLMNESHVRKARDRIVKTHPSLSIPDITNPPEQPNSYLAALCREFVADSSHEPVKVDCAAVETAALATLWSMKRKYGLQMYISKADRNGKEVVLTIDSDDGFDFAIVPIAPFLLLGGGGAALGYRLLTPVHANDLVLLRKGNKITIQLPTILVYAESSAAEQWYNMLRNRAQESLWRKGHPWGNEIIDQFRKLKEPIWVDRLEDLIDVARAKRGRLLGCLASTFRGADET